MANHFHPTATISPLSSIEISQRGTDTRVGENSKIDDFVKIKHVGGSGHIVIGNRVMVNSGCVLYSGNGIAIGDDSAIGPNCSLTPVNHAYEDGDTPINKQGFLPSRGGLVIGRDVWIGAAVTLLDGAEVGDGCVVGAGSLVNKKLEPYGIYVGTPCRKIGVRKRGGA
jgi:acetyltransferase-like isoleucine patch superfamily enzyme